MSDPTNVSNRNRSPADVLRPLRQVRQYREYTDEPPTDEELDAILNVARWSGSSSNSQPWRFIVVRDAAVIHSVAEIGVPQTRALRTAPAVIAIALPEDADRAVSYAYDDGRVAERILIAASMIGLGAGIAWVRADIRPHVHALLGVPEGRFVRTIMAVGRPSEAARQPKAAPGTARLPRNEVILRDG
jgi:nitroreductase